MSYLDNINDLAKAMGEQNDEPVFHGDVDAAMAYNDKFINTILVYYQSILASGLFENMKALGQIDEEMQKQEEELMQAQMTARDAVAEAIDDMNQVCQAYGVEKLTDIDTGDPQAVRDFVGEFCSELSREDGRNEI